MLSKQDIDRLLGRLEGAKTTRILELHPSLADLESAAMCLSGSHDVTAKSAHHTSALAEAIVEIVCEGNEDPTSRG